MSGCILTRQLLTLGHYRGPDQDLLTGAEMVNPYAAGELTSKVGLIVRGALERVAGLSYYMSWRFPGYCPRTVLFTI